MILHRGVVNIGYNVQVSVDTKNKLIMHFDTEDVNDTRALAPVAIATKGLLKVEKIDVLANKGYHTGEQLQQFTQENINAFVSPKEPTSNDEDIFPSLNLSTILITIATHVRQAIYLPLSDY